MNSFTFVVLMLAVDCEAPQVIIPRGGFECFPRRSEVHERDGGHHGFGELLVDTRVNIINADLVVVLSQIVVALVEALALRPRGAEGQEHIGDGRAHLRHQGHHVGLVRFQNARPFGARRAAPDCFSARGNEGPR